jgi:hypothetical protein
LKRHLEIPKLILIKAKLLTGKKSLIISNPKDGLGVEIGLVSRMPHILKKHLVTLGKL